ncbi:hypothetical protein [Chryseobacterium indologenes]|uniref:hypothetical protein n=1 Tax=Chryseobacterium indologenes TaxID=253 RepID=UPI000764C74C|nr:hypothetical protein [Chryseobacterium indologenes]
MKKLFQIAGIACLVFAAFSCNSTNDINDEVLTQNRGVEQISKQNSKQYVAEFYKTSYGLIHRFYKDGRHFYTTDYNEGVINGFQYEGDLGYIIIPKYPKTEGPWGKPLYRWRHKTAGDRLMTVGLGELLPRMYTNHVPIPGGSIPSGSPNGDWIFEGLMGYVSESGYVGANSRFLYRYYNPQIKDHLFTKDPQELGNGRAGYIKEVESFMTKIDPNLP